MADVQKTPRNWKLITSISLLMLLFAAISYYFVSEVENEKNQSIASATKACVERVNVKKAKLVQFCDKNISVEDKKLCKRHNDAKLIELENECPRELGALRAGYRTFDRQVLPFVKAALITILFWAAGFGGRKIYLKLSHKD